MGKCNRKRLKKLQITTCEDRLAAIWKMCLLVFYSGNKKPAFRFLENTVLQRGFMKKKEMAGNGEEFGWPVIFFNPMLMRLLHF